MKKDTAVNIAVIGGGALLVLYVLGKTNIAGAVTKGGIDVFKEVIGGVGGAVSDTYTETIKAGGNIVAKSAYNVGTHPRASSIWDKIVSFSPLGGFGASAALAHSLSHKYQPAAKHIDGGTGYDTPSGLTYITNESQARAASIQQLMNQYHSAGDVAYMQAIAEGKDVSNWNMSGLTPEFKQAMNLTGVH